MAQASKAPWTLTITADRSLFPELKPNVLLLQLLIDREVSVFHVPSPAVDVELGTHLEERKFQIDVGADSTGDIFTAPPPGGLVVADSALRAGKLLGCKATVWTMPLERKVSAALIMDVAPEKGRKAGLYVFEVPQYVARIVAKVACRHLDRAIDLFTAAQLLSRLPHYDLAPLLARLGLDQTVDLFKALLREDLSLAELPGFAPLLADEERRVIWSPGAEVTVTLPRYLIVPQARPADDFERWLTIARAISVPVRLRQIAQNEPLQTWLLSEESAAAFAKRKPDEDKVEATLDRLRDAEGILLAPPQLRRTVAQRTRATAPNISVVVAHELPRGAKLQGRGAV